MRYLPKGKNKIGRQVEAKACKIPPTITFHGHRLFRLSRSGDSNDYGYHLSINTCGVIEALEPQEGRRDPTELETCNQKKRAIILTNTAMGKLINAHFIALPPPKNHKWIRVGSINDEGRREIAKQGVPQGAVISPLLANIYLHYVFDKWVVG